MALALPFAGVERRVAWLRGILLGACFFGMITSTPLWLNTRTFPLVPIGPWFPVLPSPWDQCLFGSLLLALVLAAWRYRPMVIYFLSASFFAFCQDQNRGQPWFYIYWVMLLLTLFPVPIAACRVAMSAVYVWSGVQKFNSRFFQVAPMWFVEPATRWHFPPAIIDLLRWSIAGAPFLELGIGLALWVPRLRRATLIAVVLVHLAVLTFLGPTGHNYNVVVWPWNVAMVSLVWALFAKGMPWEKCPGRKAGDTARAPGISLKEIFSELRRSGASMVIVLLFSLLPILSFFGKWDSFFSFSIYSETPDVANAFVTQAFIDRLPPNLRQYAQPFEQTYDPERQGPFLFGFQAWCYEELHVPPIPEPRNFHFIFNYLRAYSPEVSDLRMIVGTRGGPVIFYQGDSQEFLTPAR
jgi:hypothetical protein